MSVDEKQLLFAKSYPFESPSASYIFTAKGPEPIHENHDPTELIKHRTPVLAYGSNSAPIQLKRKFHEHLASAGGFIPVLKGYLLNYDVVYSPVVAPYGSIPATITPSPGVIANAYVTYLDQEQLAIMHRSEGVGYMYDYLAFDENDVQLEYEGFAVTGLHTYLSQRGPLALNKGIVALAEVEAAKRQFPAMTQTELLTLVKHDYCTELPLNDFISNTIEDQTFRSSVNHHLLHHFSIPSSKHNRSFDHHR
ncbi:hypothetical protein [Salisediminibacterium beveridgei]|nr:hypothetical protein [Salisediminibacterium beveridgei]